MAKQEKPKIKETKPTIVGHKKEKKKVHHPPKHDELGNLIHEAYDEEIEIEVPIIEDVTVERELTDKEIEEMEKMANVTVPKSLEEVVADLFKRVEELEKAFEELKQAKEEKPKPKP